MTTRQALCAMNLTPADLSAWRSRVLPDDAYRRIAQHIPTCRACQATLAEYADLADALRGQQVPPTGMPLWRATKTKIDAYERSHMNRSQNYLIAGGLGVLGVLVLAFVVILATSLPANSTTAQPTAIIQPTATGTGHKHPTATSVPRPTPTAMPLPAGWTDARLPYAKDISFGVSDPQTGYVCGNLYNGTQGNGTQNGAPPLELGVTHDGGATWQGPMTLPFSYGDCRIQVNPFNANDLLIGEFVCYGCDGSALYPRTWYRSLDGGATWHLVPIPAGVGEPNDYLIQYFMWGGQTLYMQILGAPGYIGPLSLAHSLAASVNGGAFTWIDSHLNVASLGSHISLGLMGTVGSTLLVSYLDTTPPASYGFVATSDNGATWSHFTAQGTVGYRLYPSLDGTTIYSTNGSGVTRSSDGGHTWMNLPVLPATPGALLESAQPLVPHLPASSNGPVKAEFGEAPDGTIFLGVPVYGSSYHDVLYEWSPGATQWRVLDNHGPGTFSAVTVDANGHPVAVWDTIIVYPPTKPGVLTPLLFGLASHSAP